MRCVNSNATSPLIEKNNKLNITKKLNTTNSSSSKKNSSLEKKIKTIKDNTLLEEMVVI